MKFGMATSTQSTPCIDPSTLDRAALLLRLLLLITWKYGYDITITSAINKSYLVLKSTNKKYTIRTRKANTCITILPSYKKK